MRDVVEHDRGDDLVGARDRLEDARDEAPERTDQHPGGERDRDGDDRRLVAHDHADDRPQPSAPIRNWPWAPMLNRPALKPSATDRPPRISGVACTSVLTIALRLPDGALDERADRPRSGGPSRTRGPATSSSENDDHERADDQRQQDRDQRQGRRPPTSRSRAGARRRLAPRRSAAAPVGVVVRRRRPSGSRRRLVRRVSPAGRHQQADLVLVGRPAVDHRRRSRRGT